VQLYYSKLTEYMQRLLELTLTAIRTQSDNVARQAIAFWSAVCDAEYEMIASEAEDECKKFIMGATPYLVPELLKTMTCQVGLFDRFI
jgi:importin subunit beta-1